MRKSYTLLELERIEVPNPKFDDENTSLGQLAVQSRRKMVNKLRLRGYTNEIIAIKLKCSLSTVEKINHQIRESGKRWFENECINDYCESLQDSIILCDNAIEDLQILYSECDDLDSKLTILSKISDFEEKKMSLYSHTQGVQKYLQSCNLTKTEVVMCE